MAIVTSDKADDYQKLRYTWHEDLTTLRVDIERTYGGEEDFLRLPDKELDWKYNSWQRLQNIINNRMTQQIFDARESWPAWLKQVWDILLFVDPHRTCLGVLYKIIPILEQTP